MSLQGEVGWGQVSRHVKGERMIEVKGPGRIVAAEQGCGVCGVVGGGCSGCNADGRGVESRGGFPFILPLSVLFIQMRRRRRRRLSQRFGNAWFSCSWSFPLEASFLVVSGPTASNNFTIPNHLRLPSFCSPSLLLVKPDCFACIGYCHCQLFWK